MIFFCEEQATLTKVGELGHARALRREEEKGIKKNKVNTARAKVRIFSAGSPRWSSVWVPLLFRRLSGYVSCLH